MPYAPQPVFSPQRLTAIAVILALHIGLIVAIKSGLARQVVEMIKGPIDVQIIKDVVEPEKTLPPPPVKIETPPPYVPQPEIVVDIPPDPPTAIVTTSVVAPPPPSSAPSAPNARVVSRTSPGTGKNFPNSEEYYPPAAKRLNEEGRPIVNVCVGPDGRLTAEPKLETSSGSSRLDEGAVKLAKAGSGKYIPGTLDGKPTTACFRFMVRFEMRR